MSRDYANPDCPDCHGAGFIYPVSMFTRVGEKGGHFCPCALDGMRRENMERIWESLSLAPDDATLRAEPPLRAFIRQNLWITAPGITFGKPLHRTTFGAHLKALMYMMPTMWDCRVFPDTELITSWFGTAKAQGIKIMDLEADKSTLQAIDIRDLMEPPELVIIICGLKRLPNKECKNAILEALGFRAFVGKPTWLVDQPGESTELSDPKHQFFSDDLIGRLRTWVHVRVDSRRLNRLDDIEEPQAAPVPVPVDPGRPTRKRKAKGGPATLDEVLDDALGDLPPEDTSLSGSAHNKNLLSDLAQKEKEPFYRPKPSLFKKPSRSRRKEE